MRHDQMPLPYLFDPKRALDLHGSSISLREKVVQQRVSPSIVMPFGSQRP